jgi:hypothetical protein
MVFIPLADYGTDGFGVELYVCVEKMGARPRAPIHPGRRRCGSTPVLTYIEYAPLWCYGAVTVPWRLSIITGELRKSIVGGPPNLASTIALQSPP